MTRTIGFTCGAFDLTHAGHYLMFKECKNHCDYLIVGLQTNPKVDRMLKNEPIMSLYERSIILNSCKYIDEVIVYETENELLHMLKTLPIDIRFLDIEYLNKPYTGRDLDIKVHYNKRNHNYSTTKLRHRVFVAEMLKSQMLKDVN